MTDKKITLTVDRIEEEKVVLRTDDGQELVVDISLVPSGTGEGEKLYMHLSLSPEATTQAKLTAKDLIKAILNNNKS